MRRSSVATIWMMEATIAVPEVRERMGLSPGASVS